MLSIKPTCLSTWIKNAFRLRHRSLTLGVRESNGQFGSNERGRRSTCRERRKSTKAKGRKRKKENKRKRERKEIEITNQSNGAQGGSRGTHLERRGIFFWCAIELSVHIQSTRTHTGNKSKRKKKKLFLCVCATCFLKRRRRPRFCWRVGEEHARSCCVCVLILIVRDGRKRRRRRRRVKVPAQRIVVDWFPRALRSRREQTSS